MQTYLFYKYVYIMYIYVLCIEIENEIKLNGFLFYGKRIYKD